MFGDILVQSLGFTPVSAVKVLQIQHFLYVFQIKSRLVFHWTESS